MYRYTVTPGDVGNAETRKVAERKLVDCSAAIEKEPANPSHYVERGKVHQSLRQYRSAIEDFSTALRLDPERSHFYLYLRHLQSVLLGELPSALQDMQNAVRLAPAEFNDYYKCLAYVHQQLGETNKALDVLNEAVEIYPIANSYLRRAAFCEGIGLLNEAVMDVSRAIELESESWRRRSALHDRARLFIKLGRLKDAMTDCNACIREQPADWTNYRIRSEVYAAMGNAAAARSDYDKSMDLNPSIGGR